MKLLQINEIELKIVLSKEALSELHLTFSTIDYNTTQTRKAIWEIFDRARVQTGFDAAKAKVYIKLYPLSDGGCEMLVSKLGNESDTSFAMQASHFSKKRSVFKYNGVDKAFRFDSFDDLYCACRAIGHHSQSALYLDNNEKYILLLKCLKSFCISSKRWNEFALPVKSDFVQAYLNERCTLLCSEGAVERIVGKG